MFVPGRTTWHKDYVCEQAVRPLEEITIENVRYHLFGLIKKEKIILQRYPEGICDPAEEDASLVRAATRKFKYSGEQILDLMRTYHPQLVDRVLQAIHEV